MAYPPNIARIFNFLRALQAGEDISAAKLDGEFNNIVEVLSQLLLRHRAITTASGQLKNVAAATAAALLGRQRFIATSNQTVFTTTIPYDAVSTVDVYSSGTMLDPSTVTTANSGGYMQVTVPARASGAIVVIEVWSTGAGVLTQLASNAHGSGAALVAIEDAASIYTAADVEGALAEVMAALNAYIASIGTVGNLLRADGTVAFTGSQNANGHTIHNLADGVASGDPVTVSQLASYVALWTALQAYYVKRDGSTAFAGDQSMANHRLTDVADPTDDYDAVNKRSIASILSASGSLPIGIECPYVGSVAPAGWLIEDGSCYSSTAYPILSAMMPTTLLSGPTQGCRAAGFAAIASGNLSGGTLTSLPTLDGGAGYATDPTLSVVNTDGGAAVTVQPTFTVTRTPYNLNGAVVSGGVISIAIATAGSGIRAGAIIKITNVTGTASSFVQIPNGYFRVPDRRGRVPVGAGTESKTPGIIDPPAQARGDNYDASTYAVGATGGEEKHLQTVNELAPHRHAIKTTARDGASSEPGNGGTNLVGTYPDNGTFGVLSAGGGQPFNVVQPYFASNWIIKAA